MYLKYNEQIDDFSLHTAEEYEIDTTLGFLKGVITTEPEGPVNLVWKHEINGK